MSAEPSGEAPVLVLARLRWRSGHRLSLKRGTQRRTGTQGARRGQTQGTNEGDSSRVPSRYIHVVATAGSPGRKRRRRDHGPQRRPARRSTACRSVRGARRRGQALYTNAEGSVARSLSSIPTVPAHGELTWIDDQVPLSGVAARVTEQIGEGAGERRAAGRRARTRRDRRPRRNGRRTTVTSPGPETYPEVAVYATAVRGGRIVAVGRAILAGSAPKKATKAPPITLAGSAAGAPVRVTAPVP